MAHFTWSAPDHLTGTFRGLSLALCLLLATVAVPPLTASQAGQGASIQSDAIAKAMRDSEDTIGRGDALAASGDYLEAVKEYARATRVAYNEKLKTATAEAVAATPGYRRVVQTNFALFRRNLPRSAMQVMSVPAVTNCNYMLETDKSARENPGGSPAAAASRDKRCRP